MTGDRQAGCTRRLRRRALIAATLLVPPLAAALLVLGVRMADESVEQPPVEIREEGKPVRFGTVDEALTAVEARAGLVVDLPKKLPNSDYRLIYVDSAASVEPSRAGTAVIAYQDRGDRSGSWFWASQGPPFSIRLPAGLPEVETSVPGATVWFVGGPAEPVGGNVRHMQFIARSTQSDRFLSFEGPAFPAWDRATKVMESILDAEQERIRAAGRKPEPHEALEAGAAAGDQVAAVVNGVEIPLARVKQAQLFSQVLGGTAETALGTGRGSLDAAIREELLFQEAARRGLRPDPAVVKAEVLKQQQAVMAMLANPNADPKLKEVQAALAGTGFAVEDYDKNPAVFAVFERSAAIAALRVQLVADLPESGRTAAVTESRLEALYQQLRASAEVKVLIPDP